MGTGGASNSRKEARKREPMIGSEKGNRKITNIHRSQMKMSKTAENYGAVLFSLGGYRPEVHQEPLTLPLIEHL